MWSFRCSFLSFKIKIRILHFSKNISKHYLANQNQFTVIPFVIFPPKKRTFYNFSVGGTWQRPTVWTINIYRHHYIFIEVLDGRKKILKQKPHTSFNRRLSVVKKIRGDHDNGQEKFQKFYFIGGTWQRELAKGITVFDFLKLFKGAYDEAWNKFKYRMIGMEQELEKYLSLGSIL